MLTMFSRVMFTSHGNIRRKRKAPRVPPKPDSDRMVMKKLREERMRRAGANEQTDTDNHRDHARNELGYDANDQLNYNNNQQHGHHDNGEESDSDNDEEEEESDSDDDENDEDRLDGNNMNEDFFLVDGDGHGDG